MLVSRMTLDFKARALTLDVSVWMGDDERMDARQSAELTLRGVQFCILEPPDPTYPYADSEPAWFVDLCDPEPTVTGRYALPDGAFSSRFFVNQWNAFVHVAAVEALLVWK